RVEKSNLGLGPPSLRASLGMRGPDVMEPGHYMNSTTLMCLVLVDTLTDKQPARQRDTCGNWMRLCSWSSQSRRLGLLGL
ncbi:unnamed protein product, partial [Mycena citricolor]